MSSSGYRRMEVAEGETRLAVGERRDRVRWAIGVSFDGGAGVGLGAAGAAGAAGTAGARDRVRLAIGAWGLAAVGGAGGATLGAARRDGITLGAHCFGGLVTGLVGVSTLGDGLSGCGACLVVTLSTGSGVAGILSVAGTSGCCGL